MASTYFNFCGMMASSPAVFSIINIISRIDGILIIIMISFSAQLWAFCESFVYKINFNGIQSCIPAVDCISMNIIFGYNNIMIW